VSLQVPSQQAQRALCSNSRSGQPTTAWHAQGAQGGTGAQQAPPLHQQGSSISSLTLSESGGVVSVGDAAGDADVAEGLRSLQKLESKQPHWNGALRVWCLNFNGRVSQEGPGPRCQRHCQWPGPACRVCWLGVKGVVS
jgi:hypothetical protein